MRGHNNGDDAALAGAIQLSQMQEAKERLLAERQQQKQQQQQPDYGLRGYVCYIALRCSAPSPGQFGCARRSSGCRVRRAMAAGAAAAVTVVRSLSSLCPDIRKPVSDLTLQNKYTRQLGRHACRQQTSQ